MCTESDDYVWFYECLKEKPVQKREKKAPAIRYQDPEYISYYADMAHRPTGVRSNEIRIKETMGGSYERLCCPATGRPVLTEDDEFIWAYDLNKRKQKPTRTVSDPVNGSISAPKVLQKNPESKDSDGRQTEGKHREINPPGQGSYRDKLPSQCTSGEGTSSKGKFQGETSQTGWFRDKLPTQSSSKIIPPKRSDSNDKSSTVVPSKQSDHRDNLPKRSDARKPSEKKSPDGKSTSKSGSTTIRPVAGRSQTFA
ncbi:hypothetical protein EAF00_005925 [Botryotinia globosa]|nr:hypothetical protein EAF00_005925 [Botryotinia globosa]